MCHAFLVSEYVIVVTLLTVLNACILFNNYLPFTRAMVDFTVTSSWRYFSCCFRLSEVHLDLKIIGGSIYWGTIELHPSRNVWVDRTNPCSSVCSCSPGRGALGSDRSPGKWLQAPVLPSPLSCLLSRLPALLVFVWCVVTSRLFGFWVIYPHSQHTFLETCTQVSVNTYI